MFVFTGHRGPGGCRRSKNKSSTDFWSFVWRISPQHFWHISTFACFCFTELATQELLFLSVYGWSAKDKSLSFFPYWSLIEADFFWQSLLWLGRNLCILRFLVLNGDAGSFSWKMKFPWVLNFQFWSLLNSNFWTAHRQFSTVNVLTFKSQFLFFKSEFWIPVSQFWIPVSHIWILNSVSEFRIETLGWLPENQIAKSRSTRAREI